MRICLDNPKSNEHSAVGQYEIHIKKIRRDVYITMIDCLQFVNTYTFSLYFIKCEFIY